MAQERDSHTFEDVGKQVDALRSELDTETQTSVTDSGVGQKLVEEVESLCMNCQKNVVGATRLLLTRIPYFREVILMSFSCSHCGLQNSEVQSAGEIQEDGVRYRYVLSESLDLQRQVVKSDTCTARFEDIDVEIPAGRGRLTNVEGLLLMLAEDLGLEQPAREKSNPDAHAKIEEIVKRAKGMSSGEGFPFTFTLDDPAGNSWVEPSMTDKGSKLVRAQYKRSPEQNRALALVDADGENADGEALRPSPKSDYAPADDFVAEEVYSFHATCPGCARPCTTKMTMVDVPNFKEVVVMSTTCERCGYRSNEIKTGGAVPDRGSRITLKVGNAQDLSRDVLKSETCTLSASELGLSVEPGTMGGRFTTVEGLLTQVRDDLHRHIFDLDGDDGDGREGGDSLPEGTKRAWKEFFDKLNKAIAGEVEFALVLQDPLAGSYVQNLYSPDPDPQISIEDYERTDEENEDLGLNDVNVEGYSVKDGKTDEGENIGNKPSDGGPDAADQDR